MKFRWLALVTFALFLAGCEELRPVFPTPTTPGPAANAAVTREAMPTPTVRPAFEVDPPSPPQAAPRYRVCTGYPRGALNVRACPGAECAVRFIVAEGARVFPAGERARVGESTWVRLESPAGWVNARYLCQEEGHE